MVSGARVKYSGRSGAGGTAAAAATGAAVEAATGAAVKVTTAAVCCGSVRGATEVAVVNGARAEFCCRSGAGGAMKTAGGDEVRGDFVDDDSKVSPLMLATRAACSRFKAAISSSMVCCWAVTSWERVRSSWALPSCISAVRLAAAAEESCASWSRRAAIPEQERKSGAILFSYKFIRTLLALASKVAVGELVAIEVLMYTTVRSIKDGKREARQASNMDFIRGEARGGANGVVIGILWCSLQTIANV